MAAEHTDRIGPKRLNEVPEGVHHVAVLTRSVLFADALVDAIVSLPGFTASRADPQEARKDPTPHVIVIEVDRRRELALEFMMEVRAIWPDVPIVLLTTSSAVAATRLVKESSAVGALTPTATVSELHEVLSATVNGGITRAKASPARTKERRRAGPANHRLTPRELQVVRLLALGQSVAQISCTFQVSPHTVRKHAQNAMCKLNASSRLELVALARMLGLIEPLPRVGFRRAG